MIFAVKTHTEKNYTLYLNASKIRPALSFANSLGSIANLFHLSLAFIFFSVGVDISGELSAAVRCANRIAVYRITGAPMLGANIEYVAQAIQLQ